MGQFLFGLLAGVIVGLVMEWVIDWTGLLPKRSPKSEKVQKPVQGKAGAGAPRAARNAESQPRTEAASSQLNAEYDGE